MSNTASTVGTNLGRRGMTIALVVLTFVAIIVIIVYIIYRIRNRNLQTIIVVNKPLKLFDMESPLLFERDKIPPTNNGQEFTYSFWLYLVDYDEISSNHRLVFMRNTESTLGGASPVVFLDGRTNKLYLANRTNMSNDAITSLDQMLPENNIANGYLTGVVEYVPLQRWINITIVVQDNLVMLYQDGEVYSVLNVHDLWDASTASGSQNRPVLAGTSGDVHVGRRTTEDTPTYGFISGLTFYNHAISQRDIGTVFSAGPTPSSNQPGFMDKYGLRSPIYKVDGAV